MEFLEDIDSVGWASDPGGVRYKAAFLPEAVRVTLRVVNEDRGDGPKTLQRVIWIKHKSR